MFFLYVAVESARLFPDSKQFPDAVPKSAPKDILALYHSQRPRSPEQLRKFVAAHFLLPEAVAAAPVASEHVPIGRHIDSLWEQLTRSTAVAPAYSSLLPLPRPYVVPGGRFREVYYWDSYFTMLGLLESGRGDLVEGMVADFAHLVDTFGHIPNGARTYYLSRSQPPFFFAMVELLSGQEPAHALATYLPQLKKEYAFWMDGAAGLTPGGAHRRVVALEDGSILNRYWDDRDTPRDEAYWEDTTLARAAHREPAQLYRDIRAAAESGWDFSSRWLADARTLATIDTTEIIPVDLNSLLFGLESVIRAGCERAGDRACAQQFAQRATAPEDQTTWLRLNLDYFLHSTQGVEMSWDGGSPRVGNIFSNVYEESFGPARRPGSALTERDRDISASLQLRLEEVAFHTLDHLHAETGLTDLGLAGGVAYNSVMNGKILLNTPFRRVFIQPAAGDSGTALGVCYQIWNDVAQVVNSRGGGDGERTQVNNLRYIMDGPYTGPEFSAEEIRRELENSDLKFEEYSDGELTGRAARDIADGAVVGWFQGRMEFGPRALGNRSIVADPRRADMKDILNQRIKKREPFRPFAPSILAEHVADYFEQTHPAPTMLMVYQIKPERRAEIPAVTHIDGSGRLQTVSREMNPHYYQLIEEFYKLSGVPMILNTSFNENEPIVCTPRDAIDCFLKTKMDVIYLGNYCVRRAE